ncbi:MAG: class I SAM-dependent methyltransferase [Microcoleaceae cyanobacterium]
MKSELLKYIKNGYRKVEGWLSPIAINIITELAAVQQEMEITGSVGEIGVHHGKLFILIHFLTGQSEKTVAWDLFDRQAENVDNSGCGNQSIFKANLQKNKCDLSRIKVFTENSMNLTAEIIERECEGKPRLFSIDGGHTAEITYHDLSQASKALKQGGLIIIDDFFNEAWPGVSEGVCQYLIEGKQQLFPVVIAGNKYIFTNDEKMAKTYIQRLNINRPGYITKMSQGFGKDVLVIVSPNSLKSYMKQTLIWKKLRKMPFKSWIKSTINANKAIEINS